MLLSPLPPFVVAATAAAEPWPVTSQRAPMMYQPLEYLEAVRVQQQKEEKTEEDGRCPFLLPPSPKEVLSMIETTESRSATEGDSRALFARVATALLYLSHGRPDECHALVTPLSWHEATHFAGPPVVPKVPARVEALATYAHSLLHRWEGSNVGELNMPGYSNALYWGRATLSSSYDDALRSAFRRIRQAMELMVNDFHPSDDGSRSLATEQRRLSDAAKESGHEWFRDWIVKDMQDESGWEPRALTDLCRHVEQQNKLGSTIPQQYPNWNSGALAEFCAWACRLECLVLMDHCWNEAGYQSAFNPFYGSDAGTQREDSIRDISDAFHTAAV